MSNVYVGYSPNDFFYADNPNDHYFPTPEECSNLLAEKWKHSHCTAWFSDNSMNCIKREICKNQQNVNSINAVDASHNSIYAKNTDNSTEFQDTFLNTINLGIGILFIILMIFKIQSASKNKKII
jgi:hypothetical protein